jgi:hypothetical protein
MIGVSTLKIVGNDLKNIFKMKILSPNQVASQTASQAANQVASQAANQVVRSLVFLFLAIFSKYFHIIYNYLVCQC